MLLKQKMHAHAPVRTQQRNGSKRATAPFSAVVALMMIITLGIVADGSSDPALAATPPTDTASPPANWRLAFNADFSGTSVDPRVWGECYPWANASQGCTNFGNGSEEKEWYTESQIRLKKGVLDLVAQRVPTPGYNQWGQPEEYDCRSGMVTTYPSFDFTYGFVQVVARVPRDKGMWPAFWLAAQNWQWPPEIDILEHWGTSTTARATLHPVWGPQQFAVVPVPDMNKGWHTFTMSWTPASVTWWYDGKQVLTTTQGVPQQAMYLILNLAVDDDSPGGCDGRLSVKSVKVWLPPGG
jgi:beta-glucanase (GH16 family)